ncbi:hypothetical protein [Actinophytocola sp.]|uniref:hypothetical protein n=1 Tax=Actinophytocola sp. TaxID=1872138 RepID=UPI002D730A3A|nr:hypothetical protein [Actinophytocola sp.]HYQ69663.1 hypothetical protein [Actinophytocola sp.]
MDAYNETTPRQLLSVLQGHLNRHPHLDATMSGITVSFGELKLQPYPFGDGDFLAMLAAWALTLAGTSVRVNSVSSEGGSHVYLFGQMTDDVQVKVVAVLGPNETDSLAAHIPIREGEAFPVELLLRLTSHVNAEQAVVKPGPELRPAQSNSPDPVLDNIDEAVSR